ncbi:MULTISPECIES: 16S rRNA (cytosine(1402)-N(4))-methyltransferase RsmH [Fictibacillus]|uniref:Ribosomal RNA small subunit methyltransferase H n=1 Tax=Fictibacillus enclensis TaxID=1017270 RepID=A0A0V8JCT7_9BACL|nr:MULTISPECIES: 16S rRNA (cytosine(1402)-N(4))-methyltransferase RsmH [Fictibacillus]KSU84978.1 ribosomal RNA small subunit methyltransferase H [Fictibacillus enclensis]RXY99364.1 16S rRNA (cytosine(1402)-N(4))-methyltransferase RsmH [Fictibacillus sp. S7]SCB88826.1 16S rRNA (cytosine1402-N4)-methyltransferase [Fictibacillus enclensis]
MFDHITVLKEEAVDALNVKPDGVYVDCTLGGAGHSALILSKLTSGHLFAFDQDDTAIDHAKAALQEYEGNFTIIKSNFRYIKEELKERGVTKVDGILFDLGVSSPQLDEADRGFSYQYDAPLDMRMDQSAALSAHEVVNEWPYEKLVKIIFQYGEEKFAKQIARKIEAARKSHVIESTGELVELIKDAIPAPARRTGGHPAKRTFQAIRIAVNDELKAFEEALENSVELLSVGGRLSVITFHSLEDRACKTIIKKHSTGPALPPGLPIIPEEYQPVLKNITRKPILPREEEIDVNRRSRSAKLRIAEKQK